MARRVKGGQKLVKSAKTSRMKSSIKQAQEKDRKHREGLRLKKAFELQRKMRPRRKSDPTFAGGRRGGRPSA